MTGTKEGIIRAESIFPNDSTNKNSDAGDIDIVEFGKAKDDKALPVFNLSIAMDKTNRVPLFYEEYPGSITDVSQFTFMVDKVIEYGYKKIGFILDRGYFSKENIRYIDENGYTFIIMCKGCRSLVSRLVLDNRELSKQSGRLRFDPTRFMVLQSHQDSMRMTKRTGISISSTILTNRLPSGSI